MKLTFLNENLDKKIFMYIFERVNLKEEEM